MRLYTDSWAVADGLTEWSGTEKEYSWKTDNKEIWETDMWIDLTDEVKN